jgi:hypothetical protein
MYDVDAINEDDSLFPNQSNNQLKQEYLNVKMSFKCRGFDFSHVLHVVEIRMKSAAAGKTRFFDPPHMIFAA